MNFIFAVAITGYMDIIRVIQTKKRRVAQPELPRESLYGARR